jgi:hypothetical protein
MKKTLLTAISSLIFGCVNAQTREEIQQWQSLHPDKILLKKEVYNQFTKDVQDKISNRVVFLEEITQEFALGKSEFGDGQTVRPEELELIKQWKADHSYLKLVPRSVFNNAGSEQQLAYQSENCLILKGEALTIQDILEYNH